MTRDRGFFTVLSAFVAGVAAGSFLSVAWAPWFALGGALLVAGVAVSAKPAVLTVSVAALIALALGALSVTRAQAPFTGSGIQGSAVSGTARIIGDPQEKSFYRSVVLAFEKCDSPACPESRVLWQAPRIGNYRAGERLTFACALERPENFDPAFDYRMSLGKDGIGYLCKRAQAVEPLPDDGWTRGAGFLFAPKRAFERALSAALPEPESGLAKGLLLGGNDYLPTALKDAFATVGLSHIVAVSGYNITLIVEFFVVIGLALGLWRKQAILLALAATLFFVLMIGAPASAVRAGLMAASVSVATWCGRKSSSVNGLLLAAGLMLAANPLLLRYDIGFQLSFLATLGIVLGSAWLDRLVPAGFRGRSFVELLWLTASAQLLVLPLIVFQFRAFSPFMLLANALILPLVPYAMAFSFGSAALALIVPLLGTLFSWPAYAFLYAITASTEGLSRLPFARLPVSELPLGAYLLWYVVVLSVIVGGERFFDGRMYAQKKMDRR